MKSIKRWLTRFIYYTKLFPMATNEPFEIIQNLLDNEYPKGLRIKGFTPKSTVLSSLLVEILNYKPEEYYAPITINDETEQIQCKARNRSSGDLYSICKRYLPVSYRDVLLTLLKMSKFERLSGSTLVCWFCKDLNKLTFGTTESAPYDSYRGYDLRQTEWDYLLKAPLLEYAYEQIKLNNHEKVNAITETES